MSTLRYQNLTQAIALDTAKRWYKPKAIVKSVMGTIFTVSASPKFTINDSNEYVYCDNNIVYSFTSGMWAIIKGKEQALPITKEQKEHIINLIKSI